MFLIFASYETPKNFVPKKGNVFVIPLSIGASWQNHPDRQSRQRPFEFKQQDRNNRYVMIAWLKNATNP